MKATFRILAFYLVMGIFEGGLVLAQGTQRSQLTLSKTVLRWMGAEFDIYYEPISESPALNLVVQKVDAKDPRPEYKGPSQAPLRMFVAPVLAFRPDSLLIEDSSGNWVNAARALSWVDEEVYITAVAFLLAPQIDVYFKTAVIAQLFNIPQPPPGEMFLLGAGGHFVQGATDKGILSNWSLMQKFYVDRYSFDIMAARDIRVELVVDNSIVAVFNSNANSLHSSGSQFSLSGRVRDRRQINALRGGNFQIRSSFVASISDVKSVSVFTQENLTRSTVTSEMLKQVERASSNAKGILVWKKNKSSASSFLNAAVEQIGSSDSLQRRSVVLRNISLPGFEERVFDFIWPTVSLQEAIESHTAGAKEAADAGNKVLADAHTRYTEALKEKGAQVSVDPEAAFKALKEDDYGKFLAKGFAFAEESRSGTYSYRKLRVLNWSSSDVQAFNQLFINSVEFPFSSSIGPYYDLVRISEAKDRLGVQHLPPEELAKAMGIGPTGRVFDPQVRTEVTGPTPNSSPPVSKDKKK